MRRRKRRTRRRSSTDVRRHHRESAAASSSPTYISFQPSAHSQPTVALFPLRTLFAFATKPALTTIHKVEITIPLFFFELLPTFFLISIFQNALSHMAATTREWSARAEGTCRRPAYFRMLSSENVADYDLLDPA